MNKQFTSDITRLTNDCDSMGSDINALNAQAMEVANKMKPSVEHMASHFDEMKRTQDSANMVLKDSVDKLDKYNTRIGYLERIDLEKKLSELSRKLIAEIVRENLMPVQTNYNMELKQIKRVVEEQRDMLKEYKRQLCDSRDEIADFKLSTVFELQNYKKEAEAYMRELVRM